MKVKEVMECFFPLCSYKESIGVIIDKMKSRGATYIIVVDDKNKYKGIIRLISLINNNFEKTQKISRYLEYVDPVHENNHIEDLRKRNHEIIPVINNDTNIVGIITAKGIINNIIDILGKYKNISSIKYKSNKKNTIKYTIDDILGESERIISLKEKILAAARTNSSVLIMGETGTGKELIAHAIAGLSSRRHQPFLRINCAAIPENLLESELFGYEPGTFTGALKGGSVGKFEIANNGTIFLDEIGDMNLYLQAKILRVLQEKEIEKIGGQFPKPIDVRIIAATHQDLIKLVKEKKFRQDLFFRLHVIPIKVPPLRERKEDIGILVEHFIRKVSDNLNIKVPAVDNSFMDILYKYSWPGNVRELLNILEMASAFAKGVITEEHIPEYMRYELYSVSYDNNGGFLKINTDEAERENILKALKLNKGNKIKTAEYLGVSRSNLYYKIKKHDIDL